MIIFKIHACVIALFYAMEPLVAKGLIGDAGDKLTRIMTGLISGCLCMICILRRRLLKRWDVRILLAFFLYAFLVTYFYYGFSFKLISTTFYFLWMNLLFLFFAFRVVERPDDLLRPFSFTYVTTILLLECIIFIHATMSLNEVVPGSDRLWGCFRVGRLCGLTNANTMSFHAMTAAMLALIQWIRNGKKSKLFYGIVIAFQWFLMGMTNCRTSIMALTFSVVIFSFALLRRHFLRKGKGNAWGIRMSLFISLTVAILLFGSFLLPTLVYRGGITAFAKVSGNQQLMDNVDLVYERSITDTDTLEDRKLIWKRSKELIFKNPRRTMFGISVRSTEDVNGAYEGRHDIPMKFAHNGFLEIFRRFGLLGLCAWLILTYLWGSRAIEVCQDAKSESHVVFLMTAGAGVLLTGMTELGPFPFYLVTAVPLPFFVCCGWCMRGGEDEKA